MARRKGEVTDKQIDRLFPHQVKIEVPGNGLGKRFDAMLEFCSSRRLDYRKRGIGKLRIERGGRDAMRWCFKGEGEPVKRPRGLQKTNRPWTDAERETVLEAAPKHLKVAIALAMFTGMREGDVIRLPRNARQDDGWLKWLSGKAEVEAEWPLHSRLAENLDDAPPTRSPCASTPMGARASRRTPSARPSLS